MVITTQRGYNIECSENDELLMVDNELPLFKLSTNLNINDWLILDRNLSHSIQYQLLPEVKISSRCTNIITTNIIDENFATLLGYFIAEGCITDYFIDITIFEDDIISNVKNALDNIGLHFINYYTKQQIIKYKINSKHLIETLRSMDCDHKSKDKFIPEKIFNSPKSVKSAFLRAYFDGDGSSSNGTISCESRSKKLIEEIQKLLLSFGILCSTFPHKFSYTYKDNTEVGIAYVLNITGNNMNIFHEEIGFALSRKQKLLEKNLETKQQNNSDLFPLYNSVLKNIKLPRKDKRYDMINNWKRKKPSLPSIVSLYRLYDILPKEIKEELLKNKFYDKIESIEY
jgi:intein/homing endonuclease